MTQFNIGERIQVWSSSQSRNEKYYLALYSAPFQQFLEKHEIPEEVFKALAEWHKDLNAINPSLNPYITD